MRFERQPPLVHITASKGSSPGPCALCVRRVNLTHKVISVKIFTLSLYGRLSLDANFWFPSSTNSVDSGNWVNFLECKKFCGIIFALSKDMLQCSENILIGHSCFSVKKYACSWSSKSFDWSQLFFCDKKYAFSWSSASGRSEHIVLCHMFQKSNRNVSRCFSFFEELEAPF